MTSAPFTLDAMADTISAKSHIVNNVQEALFAPDAGLVTRPMLVDKWTVSPDGLVWTFTLRKACPLPQRRDAEGGRRGRLAAAVAGP